MDLATILSHELLSKPLALVDAEGKMRTGDKATLLHILTEKVACPLSISLTDSSHLIIDGQAMVQAIGKPPKSMTFGDMADTVVKQVKKLSIGYKRVDCL